MAHGDRSLPLERTCKDCGRTFRPRRWWSAFCGEACRNAYHVKRARVARKLLKQTQEEFDET